MDALLLRYLESKLNISSDITEEDMVSGKTVRKAFFLSQRAQSLPIICFMLLCGMGCIVCHAQSETSRHQTFPVWGIAFLIICIIALVALLWRQYSHCRDANSRILWLKGELERQESNRKDMLTVWGALGHSAETSPEELKSTISELTRQAELRNNAMLRLVRMNQLKEALLASGSLDEKLLTITNKMVETFDVDFCRIWLVKPGDLCNKKCIHAEYTEGPHACTYRERCFHLMASSGEHARSESRMHKRVPFGCYKIGQLGVGDARKFLTNDLTNDPRVANALTASQLGFVSFVGYKLEDPDRQPIGVLAFFAKQPILPEDDVMLESMANSISETVQKAQAVDALRASEEKFRSLYEASSDAVILFQDGILIDCNESALEMFGYQSLDGLAGRTFVALSASTQANGESAESLFEQHYRTTLESGTCHFEWVHLRPDSSEFTTDVLLSRVDLEGHVVIQAVIRDITDRKALENELKRLATTDPLTGVCNRRSFMDLGEKEITRAKRYNRPLSVMMLDIDHFKKINDTFGHAVGDEVLKTISKAVVLMLRDNDIFGRLGGEEFAVLLPETGLTDATDVAERILSMVSGISTETGDHVVQCTVSIGVSEIADINDTFDGLLAKADDCLYRAKQAGRDRVVS